MLEFYERRRIKRFVYSPLVIGVLCVPLYGIAHATWNAYEKEREAAEKLEKVAQELDRTKEREAYLEEELARITSERGIEQELRQKFDVGRKGEEIIVLVGNNERVPEPATNTPPTDEHFFQKVLHMIGF